MTMKPTPILSQYRTPSVRQSRRRDFWTGFFVGVACALVIAGLL